jgi:5-methylcytosine-specific restriction endonuclease McrA
MNDHWGLIYNMTGHEKVGDCYWCGSQAKKTKQYFLRYCCKEHRLLYLTNFKWEFAVQNVFKRIKIDDKYSCEKCNKVFSKYKIEVHHIVPLKGALRFMNTKNRPENLLGLCDTCHVETHKALNSADRINKVKVIKAQMLEIQPELF